MNVIQAHIYGYGNEDINVSEVGNELLYICSCGQFFDVDIDTSTRRLRGRNDYQMIFVEKGNMYIGTEDGCEIAVPAGSIIVYKPHQPQIYGCKADDRSAYYWIHFGGSQVPQLLKQMGLYEKSCYFDMKFDEYMPLVYKMISEIRLKKLNYKLQCCSIFCDIINGICRANHGECTVNDEYMRVMPAVNAMEYSMHIPYSISEYAAMCNISSYHFMHVFKKYMGTSPMQYKNKLSMEKAKYLLAHTDMSVGDVARFVGVNDTMYFSKKFRSFTGMSPSAYRNSKSNV
ncbi:MAG: AraC family transcriptional regulator [Clostridia bacterium]|nr:AraC family transcriptional regulator [Clostridia bacterium]